MLHTYFCVHMVMYAHVCTCMHVPYAHTGMVTLYICACTYTHVCCIYVHMHANTQVTCMLDAYFCVHTVM